MYATNHHTEVAFGFGIMKSFLGNYTNKKCRYIYNISLDQPPWRKNSLNFSWKHFVVTLKGLVLTTEISTLGWTCNQLDMISNILSTMACRNFVWLCLLLSCLDFLWFSSALPEGCFCNMTGWWLRHRTMNRRNLDMASRLRNHMKPPPPLRPPPAPGATTEYYNTQKNI